MFKILLILYWISVTVEGQCVRNTLYDISHKRCMQNCVCETEACRATLIWEGTHSQNRRSVCKCTLCEVETTAEEIDEVDDRPRDPKCKTTVIQRVSESECANRCHCQDGRCSGSFRWMAKDVQDRRTWTCTCKLCRVGLNHKST